MPASVATPTSTGRAGLQTLRRYRGANAQKCEEIMKQTNLGRIYGCVGCVAQPAQRPNPPSSTKWTRPKQYKGGVSSVDGTQIAKGERESWLRQGGSGERGRGERAASQNWSTAAGVLGISFPSRKCSEPGEWRQSRSEPQPALTKRNADGSRRGVAVATATGAAAGAPPAARCRCQNISSCVLSSLSQPLMAAPRCMRAYQFLFCFVPSALGRKIVIAVGWFPP